MASHGFGLLSVLNRRTMRAPVNPNDKCTIVSIYPDEIFEVKPTIEPGEFRIPAGTRDKPGILIVGPSSWWKELEENQPLLEIPQYSNVVADSIVKDWAQSMLGCTMGEAMPGLFYVEGAVSGMDVIIKHKDRLDHAYAKQKNWYLALCNMADALWATSSGNPRTISKIMRIAARELGFEDKPWAKDFQMVAMHRCDACGGLRDNRFPICPHCKVIDMNHPKARELQFAK